MLKDHLNKLEYFCTIAEHRSFLKASKYALVSQPQLSKVIRQLEEDLACTLLVRSPLGVQLTLSGEKLYQFARKTIDTANEIQVQINTNGNVKGLVRVGTYDSIARYFLPGFIKYLKKVWPDLTIELTTGRSEKLLQDIKDDDLDTVIVVGTNKNLLGIKVKSIYTDSFGLYKHVQIKPEFENCLILFPESLGDYKLDIKKLGYAHRHICDNLETVKVLTEQGIGVGLLPHRVAKDGILGGKISPQTTSKTALGNYTHEINIIFKEESMTPSVKIVLSEIEKFLKF